jgi:riboflavin synthase
MFTGIIEHVGRVEFLNTALDGAAQGARLRVHAGPLAASLAVSNSIAVNGCCLTVVEITGEAFAADLSSETLRRTSFAEIKPGTRLNLERPLTAGKEFGGHFVQGHVDGIGRVTRWEADGANWWLGVRVPQELARYVAMKGSIAIDGISLTINEVDGRRFGVNLIPHTIEVTTLGNRKVGDAVNIEVDLVARYVERLFADREVQK